MIRSVGVALVVWLMASAAVGAEDALFDPHPITGVPVRVPGRVLVDPAARRAELATLPPAFAREVCGIDAFTIKPPEAAKHPLQTLFGGVVYETTVDTRTDPLTLYLMRAAGIALVEPARSTPAITSVLGAWARADALTRYHGDDFSAMNNALYSGNRAALPILVTAGLVHEADGRDTLEAWLGRVVARLWVEPGALSSQQNHRVIRDSVHMAYGALVGNPVEFAMGFEGFARALRTARPDGALRFEIIRGARALFYQNFTIASLVTMAEIGAAQGYDLYGFQTESAVDLHRVIGFLLRGIADPSLVLPAALENAFVSADSDPRQQDLAFLNPQRGGARNYMAWVEPYLRRFPDHPNTMALVRYVVRPMLDERSGANMSCLFARP